MAFTFKEGKMASNVLDTMLTNGVASVEMKDGAFVSLDGLMTFAYEESGIEYPEYDTYKMIVPTASKDLCIIDYAGIQEVGEDNYKMGVKLYNLKVPAGYPARLRRLALHDKYWIGDGNIDSSVAVGDVLYAKADGAHTKGAHIGTLSVKILAEREFTVGMASKGKLYLVEVVSL